MDPLEVLALQKALLELQTALLYAKSEAHIELYREVLRTLMDNIPTEPIHTF